MIIKNKSQSEKRMDKKMMTWEQTKTQMDGQLIWMQLQVKMTIA